MNESSPPVAYLAEGKLFLKEEGKPPRLIDSPFVQGIFDRASRDRQRNEWKSQGLTWQLGSRGMFPPGAAAGADTRRVEFTGIARGAATRDLLYALDTDHVGGLFLYDAVENHERRLFHRNDFRARDLVRHPSDGTLAFSLRQPDGSANIAVMQQEGRGLKELTEGDSVDEAPSWAPEGRALVFQSAGIARDTAGRLRALSPYLLQKLDLDRGSLDTLLEDDAHDCLSPKMSADGALYFIRRPYDPAGQQISPLKLAGDVLLFPFRVARAIVHFLNFFSLMFSRKPLLTAGGPPKEGPDARYLMLWGKVVDAEKALKGSANTDRSLVPATWQLVRRPPDGHEQVLACGVLAYDLCSGGGVVHTNGSKIIYQSAAGSSCDLGSGRLIERLITLS